MTNKEREIRTDERRRVLHRIGLVLSDRDIALQAASSPSIESESHMKMAIDRYRFAIGDKVWEIGTAPVEDEP